MTAVTFPLQYLQVVGLSDRVAVNHSSCPLSLVFIHYRASQSLNLIRNDSSA